MSFAYHTLFFRDLPGLSRPGPPLPDMTTCVAQINETLTIAAPGVRLVEWFGNAANFVVEARTSSLAGLAPSLSKALGVPCVALSLAQLYTHITFARDRTSAPFSPSGYSQIGIAFQLQGARRHIDSFATRAASFCGMASDVVLVERHSRPTTGQTAPTHSRSYSWKRLAGEIEHRAGGVWLARSLWTFEGTFRNTLNYLDRLQQAASRPGLTPGKVLPWPGGSQR